MAMPYIDPRFLQMLAAQQGQGGVPPVDPQMMASAPPPAAQLAAPDLGVAPAGPPPSPSIWDRIRSAGRAVSENIAPTPEGLMGLLQPGDVDAARRQAMLNIGTSLLQSRGHSATANVGEAIQAGQGSFNEAIQSAAQARSAMEQRALQQREVQRQEAAETAMRDIVQRNAPVAGETPRDTAHRLNRVLGELVGVPGAEKQIASLSGYLAANNALLGDRTPDDLEVATYETGDGPGAEVVRFSRRTGEVLGREPLRAKPEGPSPTQQAIAGQRTIQNEDRLADDFRQSTRDIAQVANHYQSFVSSIPNSERGDPAAQQAMIFAWMKMLDPTSVVRPSEYATAENARGVPETIRNLHNKLLQ
jgi:hypothetical protein